MNNFNSVPPEMRDLASKSVEQAKKAFDGFFDAVAKTSTQGQEQGRQILAQAEKQVEASLDFAKRLSLARSVEEVVAIQKEFFIHSSAEAVTQMKDMGEAVQKKVKEAQEGLKEGFKAK
jgi:hypothetical protein